MSTQTSEKASSNASPGAASNPRRKRSDPTAEAMKRHRCETCFKRFDRRDTLTRHLQVHDKHRLLRKRRKKSCVYCYRSKIKCSGEHPSCATCSKRGSECVYDSNTQNGAMPSPPSPSGILLPTPSSTSNFPRQEANHHVMGSVLPQPGSDLDMSSTTTHTQDNFVGQIIPSSIQEFLFSGPYENVFQNGFDDSSFNWLFTADLDQFGLPAEDTFQGHDFLNDTHDSSQITLNSTDINYLDGTLQATLHDDQQTHSSPELPIPSPQNRCGPDDPWPMEWYASSNQFAALPRLGATDNTGDSSISFCQLEPMNDEVVENLRQTLQLAVERTPGPIVSLENFPSKEKLDHCIDMYFAHFHRMLPIIHRPTFNTGKDPVVLTLAIICIGACYTELEGAQNFAIVLSELNRRLLLFMGEYDPRFTRTDFYVAAQVLQGTHGYSSGSKRLLELSETFRCSLVNNARNMGLFLSRQMPSTIGKTPEERWQTWIMEERMRRLAWAVYGYDSSVSYLHNKRPSITISELQVPLPGSISLWEANSEHAWSALHPWSDLAPPTKTFRTVMRTLFDPNKHMDPKELSDDEHKLVVVLTMTRFLWSLKELGGSPIIDLVEDKMPLEGGQQNLLDVLDKFLESPAAVKPTHTKFALANVARIAQIVHMAHLYAAGDLIDWLHPLLRDGPGQERAQVRMKEWAHECSIRVRKVAYHCAQVLAIVRRYPFNLALEPFNVFHAGMALWCMARLLSQEKTKPLDGEESRQPIRIDNLVSERSSDSNTIEHWIQHGGPQLISLYGVPNLACSQGRVQILEQTAEILDSMHVWGIAQNFHSVIVHLIWSEEV